jgi:hypothetical protein
MAAATKRYGVSSGNVPSGPEGVGSLTDEPPGMGFPATPLTDPRGSVGRELALSTYGPSLSARRGLSLSLR